MGIPDTSRRRRDDLERRFPRWQPMTLAQHFDRVAATCPDRPCVLTDQHAYTYADMREWSCRLAAGLIAIGVEPGEHVAMILANSAEFVALKVAIARVGAVAVPLNYQLRAAELGYVLRQSRSAVLVTMDSFWQVDFLQALDALAPGWEQQGGGAALPDLRRVVLWSHGGAQRAGALTLQELGAHDASEQDLRRREAVTAPESAADIVYTSGTTGSPKGAVLSHDMVLRSAYGSALTRAFADGWRVLFALPLYHVFGYIEGLVASQFVGGAVIPQMNFDPDATLKGIERHRATEVLLVPTMTIAVVDRAVKKPGDLSSLEAVFSAAAPAPVWLWERVKADLGVEYVFTGYGSTEASASTTLTFPGDALETVSSTVGRPKIAGVAGDPALDGRLVEYQTVDPLSGQRGGPGSGVVGELVVRGGTITPGYYAKPDETTAAYYPDRWMRTGDVGRIRADGYLELTGRNVDLYKCGGELVACKEVEDVLTGHPAVAQAYVVGLPDRKLGEVGCAWVVAAEGHPEDSKELMRYCRQHLAIFKAPYHMLFVAAGDLPRTATGKVQKFRLVERAQAELGSFA
jgi:fatty-acyl-CoA synthase